METIGTFLNSIGDLSPFQGQNRDRSGFAPRNVPKKLLLVCGEPSGDIQAGLLVSRLKQIQPGTEVFAVGGQHLRNAGAEIFYNIKDISVIGLFDVIRKLPRFKNLMRLVLKKIDTLKPGAVIFVDFSGFNLRLAKIINKKIKTIYYISPQVWASRQGRIKTIRKFIDKMIVIFKFEEEFYRKFGINAEFIGHPLLDIVKPSMEKSQAIKEFGIDEKSPIFALLPGSRISEVKEILPVMMASARLIQEKIPQAQFIISKMAHIDSRVYQSLLHVGTAQCAIPTMAELNISKPNSSSVIANPAPSSVIAKQSVNLRFVLIEGRPYDCLNAADFVMAASGTATLETAIMAKPNVIIYKMGLLNYLLYRPMVKLDFIGMENIVAGKTLAPEFIQFNAKPHAIAKAALDIFLDKAKLETLKDEFSRLKVTLGEPGAALRAAKIILDFIG